jgi:hypothetical protein
LRSNEVPEDRSWWSQTESNRRHPACKAGALPTELWPLSPEEPGGDEHRRAVNDCRKAGPAGLVGPGRLELPTSRLSGVRSNQAELRAYGGTTARQKPRLAIALPITAGRMPGTSWKRKRKEKRRRRRPAVYWSSNRQSRERRPGGTSLERR